MWFFFPLINFDSCYQLPENFFVLLMTKNLCVFSSHQWGTWWLLIMPTSQIIPFSCLDGGPLRLPFPHFETGSVFLECDWGGVRGGDSRGSNCVCVKFWGPGEVTNMQQRGFGAKFTSLPVLIFENSRLDQYLGKRCPPHQTKACAFGIQTRFCFLFTTGSSAIL